MTNRQTKRRAKHQQKHNDQLAARARSKSGLGEEPVRTSWSKLEYTHPDLATLAEGDGLQSLATYRHILGFVRGAAEHALRAAHDPRLRYNVEKLFSPARDQGRFVLLVVEAHHSEPAHRAFALHASVERTILEGKNAGAVLARIGYEDNEPRFSVFLRHKELDVMERYDHVLIDSSASLDPIEVRLFTAPITVSDAPDQDVIARVRTAMIPTDEAWTEEAL